MTMEIRGTLWRKYGHDRTYLTDEAGTRLGWIDNNTGALTVDGEEHRAALEAWAACNQTKVMIALGREKFARRSLQRAQALAVDSADSELAAELENLTKALL